MLDTLRLESLAIVRATLRDVEERSAEIMLRMWHSLQNHDDRGVLLCGFTAGGEPANFVQAFIAAIRARQQGRWPMLRPGLGLAQAQLPALEAAFLRALQRELEELATPMVLTAWREMIRAFLEMVRGGRAEPAPPA